MPGAAWEASLLVRIPFGKTVYGAEDQRSASAQCVSRRLFPIKLLLQMFKLEEG
jgi:hypothetical protein